MDPKYSTLELLTGVEAEFDGISRLYCTIYAKQA